jgi:hypothetical protein
MLNFVYAQLDNLHYLQPIIFGAYNDGTIIAEHIYLSTPSTEDITVKVTRADGTTIPRISVTTISSGASVNVANGLITLKNTAPVRVNIINASNVILSPGTSPMTRPVNTAGTIIAANVGGLIFQSDDSFYVNYRARADAQAGSVMSKGRVALGKEFFWGGTPTENVTQVAEVGNMASIMATEDNTVVTLSGFDVGLQFLNGTNSTPITPSGSTITRTLNKGQSFVFYAKVKVNQSSLQDAGWLGAKITADKNIAVTVGGLMQQGVGDGRDFAVDQLVPVEQIGNEYVVMQGNGGTQEKVIVIATEANTTININGNTTPSYTLANVGDYRIVPASFFTNKNMYLKTNKAVYVFHKIYGSGSTNYNTNSFMFIPPLSCFGQNSVNMIPDAKRIGGNEYANTQLAVLAAAGSPPTVTVGGTALNPISGSSNIAVPGNPNWTSYRYNIANAAGGTATIKNVRISSAGAIQAELLGADEDAGFGGYYSGFGTSPIVDVNIAGSPNPMRPCTGTTGTSGLSVSSGLGTYQWYKDGVAIPGATTSTYAIPTADAIASDYNVIVTVPGGCDVYSNVVTSFACPCYKPGATGTPEITKIGISTRETASTPNFPADKNNGFIALESNNKGMVISRIAEPEVAIVNPVDGMIVYDTDENCLKIYDGTKWSCINQTCN